MHQATAALFASAAMLLAPMSTAPDANRPAPVDAIDAHADDSNPWLERRVLDFAHQGGEIEAPSDTMFALKTALLKGADVLEVDVHATADGEIVLMHDDTVDRTTDGSGRVDEMTLEELRSLDAAHWFVPDCGTCPDRPEAEYEYRGYATGETPIPPELRDFEPADFRVPTLREVLRTFPEDLLNIEIKSSGSQTTPFEAELAELLREFDRDTDTIVASFDDAAIARFKEHAPEISTAPGTGGVLKFWLASLGPLPGVDLPGMHALQVPPRQYGLPVVTADFVADAHAHGLAVHVWTINDRAEMERLLALGVDGIMTDRPTLLEDVLEDLDAN